MSDVSLSVDAEFQAIGTAIKGLISDIKAKKKALDIMEGVFGALVGSMSAMENLAVDARKADNVIFVLKCIVEAVIPAHTAVIATPASVDVIPTT